MNLSKLQIECLDNIGDGHDRSLYKNTDILRLTHIVMLAMQVRKLIGNLLDDESDEAKALSVLRPSESDNS